LYFDETKVLVDAVVHSENEKETKTILNQDRLRDL
jgi:hypothetical protein